MPQKSLRPFASDERMPLTMPTATYEGEKTRKGEEKERTCMSALVSDVFVCFFRLCFSTSSTAVRRTAISTSGAPSPKLSRSLSPPLSSARCGNCRRFCLQSRRCHHRHHPCYTMPCDRINASYPSICSTIHPCHPSIDPCHPSIYPCHSCHPFVHPSIYPFIHAVYQSIHPFMHPSMPPIHTYVHIYHPCHPYIYPCTHPSTPPPQ